MKRSTWTKLGLLVAGGAAALLASDAWADGIPGGAEPSMYYSGFLEDDAGPVDGTPVIQVSLWDAGPSGTGTQLCASARGAVTVTDGHFRIPLPEACVTAVQRNPNVWTEVQIGTELPLARQHLGAVPYAVEAANGVPPGTIVPFGGETVPPGWVDCDGAVVSGDAGSDYERLYAAIGEAWGDGGDGTGPQFALPDLRGQFLRGAHGTALDPDGDRAVGSLQADEFRSHTHGIWDNTGATVGGGAFTSIITRVALNDESGATGGAETRPTNAAVRYIVKL